MIFKVKKLSKNIEDLYNTVYKMMYWTWKETLYPKTRDYTLLLKFTGNIYEYSRSMRL